MKGITKRLFIVLLVGLGMRGEAQTFEPGSIYDYEPRIVKVKMDTVPYMLIVCNDESSNRPVDFVLRIFGYAVRKKEYCHVWGYQYDSTQKKLVRYRATVIQYLDNYKKPITGMIIYSAVGRFEDKEEIYQPPRAL